MSYFSLQKIKEEKRLAEERAALRRLEKDVDDSDSESEDIVPQRDETEEIMKLSSSQTRNILVWRILFGITFVATSCTGSILVLLYLSFTGAAFSISPGEATATLVSLFAASAACFMFYDRSVQARTETIVANAARANAIVTNIFPGQFRDQVFDDQESADETAATGMVKAGADGQTKITSKPLADLVSGSATHENLVSHFPSFWKRPSVSPTSSVSRRLVCSDFQLFDNSHYFNYSLQWSSAREPSQVILNDCQNSLASSALTLNFCMTGVYVA